MFQSHLTLQWLKNEEEKTKSDAFLFCLTLALTVHNYTTGISLKSLLRDVEKQKNDSVSLNGNFTVTLKCLEMLD